MSAEGGGHLPSTLKFEKMMSYAALLQNTLKFSLAPAELAIYKYTLEISSKRRKSRKDFRLSLRRAEKINDRLFKAFVVLSPLNKFLRAPMRTV